VTNEALREAGVAVRIDHRSYKDQGIDREPQVPIPRRVLYAERRTGKSTPAGDHIRARRQERVEARAKGPEELARVVARQNEENRRRAIDAAAHRAANKATPQGALTRAEINERRREWRKAHAEEINIKHREYRKRHVEQDAARRWAKLRERQKAKGQPDTKLDSARNTPTRGAGVASPTAEDAVTNWLAYRETQRRAESSPSAANMASHEPPAGDLEGAKPKAASEDGGRGRKNDAGL